MDELALADWRRKIAELYVSVRTALDPHLAWQAWIVARDRMFRTHPQSPVPADRRKSFEGCAYFPYDPAARVLGDVSTREPQRIDIVTSSDNTMSFRRFGEVEFELRGQPLSLQMYWLDGYAGGIFVPFADKTSGHTTYGAGRYLLDTAKGADLGMQDDRVILDFNFGYNPSCSYDSRWVCPLTPPPNRLDVAIEAGEMYTDA